MQEIDFERSLRFGDMNNNGADSRQRLISLMDAAFSEGDRQYLMKILSFAEGMDYQHGRLSQEVYLSHPYRVAALSIDLAKPPNVHTTALALVHNVLEVANIPHTELADSIGADLVDELRALTVDRSNNSAEYFAGYYDGLRASTSSARTVKALDKLDNMFMLCLNPDGDVRASYLEEIERYIIPVVEQEMPHTKEYFESLTENCRKVGHISL